MTISDPIPDEFLREIANEGRCYRHEAKSMARELLERRDREQQKANQDATAAASAYYGWGTVP